MKGFWIPTLAAAAVVSGCAEERGGRAALVRAPESCVDQTVQVYFEPRSAELTHEGRLVIDTAAQGVRACKVTAVEVLGLADAVGAPAASLELSHRRADAVSQALKAAGLPAAQFQVAAIGQAGAITPEGEATPLRRRVDVTLHVAGR
jgi:outer membrane protein OmpA-like peptidoglycan-associated protein